MPTAQPIINPKFEFDPPPLLPPSAALLVPGVGVRTLVTGTLTNPVDPDERLKNTEVNGVADERKFADADKSREVGEDRVSVVRGEDAGEDGEDRDADVGDVDI